MIDAVPGGQRIRLSQHGFPAEKVREQSFEYGLARIARALDD